MPRRTVFDGACARGSLDQLQGTAAIAVVVNASFGNDHGSAVHEFPLADIRVIEIALLKIRQLS